MKNKILIHLFLLTMILVTSSCTPTKIEEDPLTILAMKTCEPPCWQGITPGITTLDEAKILIQQINIFPAKPNKLTPSKIFIDGVTVSKAYFPEPYPNVEVFANEQGFIDRIVFLFDRNNRPKLGDCTDLLGEPHFIGMSIGTLKAFRSFLYFAYPQITLEFSKSMAFRPDTVRIPYSSKTQIEYVIYRSDQVKATDFDYYFPWNEKAILQFEKNY